MSSGLTIPAVIYYQKSEQINKFHIKQSRIINRGELARLINYARPHMENHGDKKQALRLKALCRLSYPPGIVFARYFCFKNFTNFSKGK